MSRCALASSSSSSSAYSSSFDIALIRSSLSQLCKVLSKKGHGGNRTQDPLSHFGGSGLGGGLIK